MNCYGIKRWYSQTVVFLEMEQPCGHLTSQHFQQEFDPDIPIWVKNKKIHIRKPETRIKGTKNSWKVEPIGRGKGNKSSRQRSMIRGKMEL